MTASGGGKSLEFSYTEDGMRSSKTVGSVVHSYIYDGGKLMRETYSGNTLDFIYDVDGRPYALVHNGTVYYYILNLQGDVIRLVNGSGTTVASYEYDPYGNVISATGTMAEINPLRYRGYYYDSETGLYYLQSRYYDPKICRFINADSFASTGQGFIGTNMFAYCNNNPVNMSDSSGTLPQRKNMVAINDGAGGDIGPIGTISSDDWRDLDNYNNAPSDLIAYIMNDDESVVLEAEYFAFYKGVPVLKADFGNGGGFSFGIIVIDDSYKNNERGIQTLNHEYGHRVHMNQIGLVNYVFKVAIPSLTFAALTNQGILDQDMYFNWPWEYTADMLGRANRDTYASWADEAGVVYWIYTILSS